MIYISFVETPEFKALLKSKKTKKNDVLIRIGILRKAGKFPTLSNLGSPRKVIIKSNY